MGQEDLYHFANSS